MGGFHAAGIRCTGRADPDVSTLTRFLPTCADAGAALARRTPPPAPATLTPNGTVVIVAGSSSWHAVLRVVPPRAADQGTGPGIPYPRPGLYGRGTAAWSVTLAMPARNQTSGRLASRPGRRPCPLPEGSPMPTVTVGQEKRKVSEHH